MGKRVLIIGPGALGVGLAVGLVKADHAVHVAIRNEQSRPRIPTRFVHIDPDGDRHEAPVTLVAPPGEATYDVLVLATKCDDAADALRTWMPRLVPGGAAVCLQNGILGDALAPIAGDALVECTVAYPATLLEPGISEQTGPGELILGAWPDGRMDPATPIALAAEVLVDAMPTRIHENMRGVKWTKLLVNSAITGLGVITGQTLGTLLQDRRARAAFLHIITEGYRVGMEQGVHFEQVGGLKPGLIAVEKPRRVALAWRHLLLRILGRKYRRQKSSSLQSLERGRRTEVHHLNGRIAADAKDVSTPVNQAIADLALRIEANDIVPDMALLDTLPLQFH